MRLLRASRSPRPLLSSSFAVVLASIVLAGCGGDSTKPAVVSRLALITPPSASATDRAALATQPVVQLQDANGASISRAGVTITAALVSGTGTLSGAVAVQTNGSGQARFTNLSLGGLAGDKVLAFSAAITTADGGVPTVNATVHLTAGPAAVLRSRAGDGQTGATGAVVGTSPSVVVQDADLNPVSGVSVTFSVASGGGTLTGATQVTDSNGVATVGSWTLGTVAGTNTLTAAVAGLVGSPITFTATGSAIIANACGSLSPTAMSLGQVMTNVGGTGICVAGGAAHQEFMLVPFYGTSDNGTPAASFTVSGVAIDTVGTTVPAALAPSANLIPGGPTLAGSRTRDYAFETRLRASEARELPRLIRTPGRTLRPSLSRSMAAIPATVQVGTLVQLNTSTSSACGTPTYATGRVTAVGQKSIVVSDTTNPAGGFTDTQFQQIAATFDTLVDPLDETAFGAPSDVDANGRIIIFFTRAVNALTPAGSNSFVGGFFYSRDLFPTVTTGDIQACPGSNYAEMFYMLAPDPTGVLGNVFSTAFVEQIATGVEAHEFQHLINAARRMYVNGAANFEEVWLNEGLSHEAEELAFYREAGLQPRQDITSTVLRASTAAVTAFNNYESANFSRYRTYLLSPAAYGPYALNDALETRGATWSLLRYLVDHTGTSDGNTWYQLVNATTIGLTNLQTVFGSSTLNEVRDWSLSVYTDDVSFGVANQWQQPSWNFRDVYPALSNHLPYALAPQSLAPNISLPVAIVPSGSTYIRFATSVGTNAMVEWGSVPTGMQMSLVRIQ